jgi:hypothetical protein
MLGQGPRDDAPDRVDEVHAESTCPRGNKRMTIVRNGGHHVTQTDGPRECGDAVVTKWT